MGQRAFWSAIVSLAKAQWQHFRCAGSPSARIDDQVYEFVERADSGKRVVQQLCLEYGTGVSYFLIVEPETIAVAQAHLLTCCFLHPSFRLRTHNAALDCALVGHRWHRVQPR
jgi:hypothetical protein